MKDIIMKIIDDCTYIPYVKNPDVITECHNDSVFLTRMFVTCVIVALLAIFLLLSIIVGFIKTIGICLVSIGFILLLRFIGNYGKPDQQRT